MVWQTLFCRTKNLKAGEDMNEETAVKKERAKFYLERDGILAEGAVLFLIQSAIFRLIGSWGRWGDDFFVATQIILPVLSCVLLALCIWFFSKRMFWLSAIPVLMGVAFFVIKALGFESMLHTVLCIILYAAVAILYTGTVFGLIRTKWLLPPLFGLPFLYHIFVEDLAAMRDTANPVTFTDGMMEMSVLCVMLALFLVGLALKKKKTQNKVELPKIKDPVVIANNSAAPAAESAPAVPAEPAPEVPAAEKASAEGDTDNNTGVT